MTPEEFKEIQGERSNKEMADLLCCDIRLIQMMRKGDRKISARTEKMLRRIIDERREK